MSMATNAFNLVTQTVQFCLVVCVTLATEIGHSNTEHAVSTHGEIQAAKFHSKAHAYENDQMLQLVAGLQNARYPNALFHSSSEMLMYAEEQLRVDKSNLKCLEQVLAIGRGLRAGQMWALQLMDSYGKPSSGILDGNKLWMGSMSECERVSVFLSKNLLIQGQYCANNLNALNMTVTLGTCIPAACNVSFFDFLANKELSVLMNQTNVTLTPTTGECHKHGVTLSWRAILAIDICCVFCVLIIAGTVTEALVSYLAMHRNVENESKLAIPNGTVNPSIASAEQPHATADEHTQLLSTHAKSNKATQMKVFPHIVLRLLMSFSLLTNVKKLLHTGNQSSTTLHSVHGIRFISMSWVILGHTFAFSGFVMANPLEAAPIVKRLTFQAIGNATVSVDTFFVLSGLLLTYLFMIDRNRRSGKTNWIMYYVHRYVRLTPTYMLILMFYHCIVGYMPTGPMWPQPADGLDPNCNYNWWTNLLYVNNLVHSDKQCMGWAWYLANDMQFYVIAPLVLLPLAYHPLAGFVSLVVLLLSSFIATGIISTIHKLGTGTVGDMDYMYQYYFKPYCRIGPYLVGMAYGWLLFKTKCKVQLHWFIWVLGWLLAITLALLTLYGLWGVNRGDVVLSVGVSAFYNTVARSAWGLAVGWVIFACACGCGGPVNTFLSWKLFVPLSRLTYCAYLVHPFVIFVILYSFESTLYYTDLLAAILFVAYLVFSYAVAFVATLAFESPILGIERVLLKKA